MLEYSVVTTHGLNSLNGLLCIPTPYNLYNTNEGSVGPYHFQIDGNFGFFSGVTEMLL